jgi:hypothetical protein
VLELGPWSQAISYNEVEGWRFKLAGNTTTQLNYHWQLGGYAAYGTKDNQWKYRGDVIYSFRPKKESIWDFPQRLLSFSYAEDWNLPGQDLLTSHRDYFFYSLASSATRQMWWQQVASVRYNQEFSSHFSFQIEGRNTRMQLGLLPESKRFTTSEISLSLRYAPCEIFMQQREKRRYLRQGTIEWNLRHRIGIKGILGSNYEYQLTDISIDTRFKMPRKIGIIDTQVSAGTTWSQHTPFFLRFIPEGNQSYIFSETGFNGMKFSEFSTNQFIAGKINLRFDWSPLDWLYNSPVKTNLGVRAIEGKNLSYSEINFGFSHILDRFRIEWVQRKDKGGIFISGEWTF